MSDDDKTKQPATEQEIEGLEETLASVREATDGFREFRSDMGQRMAESEKRLEELRAAEAPSKDDVEALKQEIDGLSKRIDELGLAAKRPQLTSAGDVEPDEERTGGFANFGEFLRTVLTDRKDPRSAKLQERALSAGVGQSGGFLVPPQFAEMLTAISPQDAIVRPRATVIPPGEPPDAPVTMPYLDQSGTKGVYAGVTVNWIGEGETKPETEPTVGELTLTPHEVAAFTTLTDKLVRNAPAASVLVQNLLRNAILAAEDTAFISGDGVGKPIGFLGHGSAINVARAGAGAIAYADVVDMYSRLLVRPGDSPVWIGNPTVLPDLQAMASALGQLIWQPNAREGEPSTLLGFPFLRDERQPVLGTAGDLMLVNLRYYLVKDGSPLAIKDDGGMVNFTANKTLIKAYWNVDGQPWLRTPLQLEDGSTTQSPFVVLE